MKTSSMLSELRKKVENVSKKATTLSQACKSLQGAATKAEAAALGVTSFNLKNVVAAWAPEFCTVDENGQTIVKMYLPQTYKVEVCNEDGEPVEVTAYEKTEGKKGVTYKTMKRRVLTAPEAWTPAIIVEGLCQCRFVELAQEEAATAEKHIQEVEFLYKKVVKKAADGSITTTFEPLCF